ncbi:MULTISPECIES: hypothetical protein [Dysgonomonas]|uniref:hypothetical protein n=1 Tax=Dysgonomonas TaxID=156973 RepID=UPI00092BBE27|nr:MULTISPECIES: hypothetical protein [Dysgonomonas]MBN9301645.1 hypothetical protein [Dysgonomonas mossii]OJX64398.1 MAG: hypothetical protein BGO84_10085 [Dysgonomonas sp. 37-18]
MIENEQYEWAQDYYMNMAQMRAALIDPNVLIAEIARGGGKTEGITGPRILRVADAMPRELAFLVHNTYAALLTNIVPNLISYFNKTICAGQRCILEDGVDYVIGTSKLPKHFSRPRYPVLNARHSIVFRNGFNLQLVSSDQPDSVAGRSGVHAFIEEMKHNKGEKLKTRLFPALRGSDNRDVRNHHLYQGITGVSDTARVDLGEDNWYEEYETNMDMNLINEIASVAKPVNDAMVIKMHFDWMQNEVKSKRREMSELTPLYPRYEKAIKTLHLWEGRLRDMRKKASFYIRASSLVNKNFLGQGFFKQQLELMDMEEFLTAICAIRIRAVVDRFFANYVPKVHQFSDSYKNDMLLKVDLMGGFRITAGYLKYYNPDDELLLGYDPGKFQSLTVSQERNFGHEVRTIKEFTCYSPADQTHLALDFYDFFGDDARNKRIKLYYDRAGNKTKEELEQITTDARLLKAELERYGFYVELMNEGQPTIYYWQQKKLLDYIFSNKFAAFPRPYICENQCPNLCSSILLSPMKKSADGKIELDKSSEKKVPMKLQAGRSTQLPSALIYFYYGRYGHLLPSEFSSIPDNLPENTIM